MSQPKLTPAEARMLKAIARTHNQIAREEPNPEFARQRRQVAKEAHQAADKVLKLRVVGGTDTEA